VRRRQIEKQALKIAISRIASPEKEEKAPLLLMK
jgi:hypothetical protein